MLYHQCPAHGDRPPARRLISGLGTLTLLLLGVALALPAGALAAAGWNPQSSGTSESLASVAFTSVNDGWAVGSGGTILHTTNGGATWAKQPSGTSAVLNGVAFANASDGWAVGCNGNATAGIVLATTDGGATWKAQQSNTSDVLCGVACTNASDAWAVGYDNNSPAGIILATTNGGATWTPQDPTTTATTAGLDAVACTNASDAWAVGGAGAILATGNGGATWSVQNPGAFDVLPLFGGVAFTSINNGWTVGTSGTILATTNGGATWSTQGSGTGKYLAAVAFANADDGWTVGDGGTIRVTTDGGATWSAQSSGTDDSLFGVSFANATHGWAVGDAGTILATTNGGYAAPRLSSFDPTSGPVGSSVTLSGSAFGGASKVGFNGVAATFSVNSATQISTTVPTGATTGPITIVTPYGTATSTADFTVIPTPTLTRFTPASGPVGGSVTLTGTGFSGATAVDFNGAYAQFTVNSATQISTTVPAGATSGPITVTTPGGVATSAASFTVIAGHISGTVKNAGGSGLGDIDVTACQPDGSYVNDVETKSDGSYDLGGLASGSYRLEFQDYSGTYLTQYYNNRADLGTANAVAVTAGKTTTNINATLALAGHIGGTVKNAGGSRLSDIDVTAYQPNGFGSWSYVSEVETASNGTYNLGGLASGSYRLEFRDYSGTYLTQYYDNQADLATANAVAVTAPKTTANINATLALAGHISGTVVNAGGSGLSNIWVSAWQPNGSYVNDVETKSDGSYDLGGLASGSYRLEFQDYSGAYLTQYYNSEPDLGTANAVAVTAGKTTANINATLALAGHISGTVKDAGGSGLGDIWVNAYQANGQGGWSYVSEVETASNGTYNLGSLVSGSYRFEFQDDSGTYLTQYYKNSLDLASATTIAVTAPKTTANINATLVTAGHISGTVKNAGGSGLGDIWVTAYQANGQGGWNWLNEVETASNGTYSLGGLASGSYRLEFQDGSGTYLTQYYKNSLDLTSATAIAVTAPKTTANINATLALAGRISGTVVNAGGSGLGDIWVTAYRPSGGWQQVGQISTTSNGSYDLGGLASGSYRLEFQDNSGTYLTQYYKNSLDLTSATAIAVTAPKTTANINATLVTAGHISGTIKNAGGGGLGDIWVRANQLDGGYVNQVETASNGTYSLGGLASGSYRVEFRDGSGTYAPQYYNNETNLTSATAIAVTAPKTTANINATLVTAGHISGTVKNASGSGLGDIWVSAYQANGQRGFSPTTTVSGANSRWHNKRVVLTLTASNKHSRSSWSYVNEVETASNGSYDLDGLASGSYRLEFRDSSGVYATQYYHNEPDLDAAIAVAVTAGKTTADTNATLATAGHISGTVVNGGGSGLGDIDVTADQPDGFGGWSYVNEVETASDGSYNLSGLDSGGYRLEFRDDSGTYATQYYKKQPDLAAATTIAVTAGKTKANINASLATAGHITGTVKNAAGSDLAGIWVTACQPDGSYVNRVTTASDGSYNLGGLASGSYCLEFQSYSKIYATQYYKKQAHLASATAIAVRAGKTKANINATLVTAGHISGTVKNALGSGLADIDVTAYQPNGFGAWSYVNDVETASNGSYNLGGLASGSYRLEFRDYSGTYLTQYYKKQPDIAAASTIAVTVGKTKGNINATLARAGRVSVAMTEYAIDGGPWTLGTTVVVPAPINHSNDGFHTVSYCSCYAAGGWEMASTVTVKIDTTGPTTSAKAAKGYTGKAIALNYLVRDNLSPQATAVTLTIRSGHGKLVKTFRLGTRKVATWYVVRWKSKAKGGYHYTVTAKDLAGNRQIRAGSAKITVK